MSVLRNAAEKLRRFFGGAAIALYPDACVGCEELLDPNEMVFCTRCEREYADATERECARCFRPRNRCICSRKALEEAKIPRLVKLYKYQARQVELPQNRLIYALKHHHRNDVRQFLAAQLAEAIRSGIPTYERFVIAYAPRGQVSAAKDGYDHMRELAEATGKLLDLPLTCAIGRRKGGKIQKKLTYAERLLNMKGRFYLHENAQIAGKSVFLFDDVVTSGATLIEAARVLYDGGAKEVIGVVIAATGRDELRRPRRFSVKYRTMK